MNNKTDLIFPTAVNFAVMLLMIYNDCMSNSFMSDKSNPTKESSQYFFHMTALQIFSAILLNRITKHKNAEQQSYNGKMVLNHSTTLLKSYKILYCIISGVVERMKKKREDCSEKRHFIFRIQIATDISPSKINLGNGKSNQTILKWEHIYTENVFLD